MIRLECKDGAHFKFWEADVKGASLTVHFGRIGTEGQVKAKKLATPAAAQGELEKLIREKLGKGYVKKGGKAAKAAPSKPKDDGKSAALLALAELLAPKHAETKRRVTLALNDPAAYAKKYAEELEDRSAEDDPVDPWLALVTALTNDDIELGTSLDWKDSAEEIQAGLATVVAKKKLGKPGVFAFYDEDAHIKTKTLDFIALSGRALSAHKLAVVQLDLASDSYELTVIPWKDLARAKELAKKAGGELISHAPKTPLAKPLAAPAPKAGPTAKIDKKRFGWRVEHDEDARLPGVLRITGEKTRKTFLIDCRVWPPKEKLLAPGQFKLAMHPADERKRIFYAVYHTHEDEKFDPRPKGTLRIERPGQAPLDLLDRLPDDYDVALAAWIGELAVFFPAESTAASKNGKRPLVWNGKTLAPAKGLPDAKLKGGFLRGHGVARTGMGEDVLLWEGMGFVAKGDAFKKAWQLVPDLQVYEKVFGAPAPGDGFFYVHQRRAKNGPWAILREATQGKCVERARLDFVTWGQPIAAPDGSIVFGVNRSGAPKKPVLGVFHPATSELTLVPPNVLAFRKDDIADGYGVSPGKGKDGAFLWVLDDEELRRVPWSAILARPRVRAVAR
jgi:predicted DNA-binding WGR domain protein